MIDSAPDADPLIADIADAVLHFTVQDRRHVAALAAELAVVADPVEAARALLAAVLELADPVERSNVLAAIDKTLSAQAVPIDADPLAGVDGENHFRRGARAA